MSGFDFDSFQDRPSFTHTTNRTNLPHYLHHSNSYQSTSRSSSRPGTPFTLNDYSFFQDALADDALANPNVPTPERFTPTPPSNFLDTILNPQSPSRTDGWSFSQMERRRRSPALSTLRSSNMPHLPNGYVDLTADASSPTSPTFSSYRRLSKRNAAMPTSPEATAGPSTKRFKRNSGTSGRAATQELSTDVTPIEEIDLVDEEDDKAPLQSALQKQRLEQVKAQEKPSEKPVKLSNLTCVICMDSPTNITATSCGKLRICGRTSHGVY